MPWKPQETEHMYLTNEEISEVRRGLNKRRPAEVYVEGQYDVSYFNRDPAVVEFPADVTVRDITLRTAEQAPVVSLEWDERLHLVKELVEAGVSSLQLSYPGLGSEELGGDMASRDGQMIQTIREINPDVEIGIIGVQTPELIDMAVEAGYDVLEFMNPAVPEIMPIYSNTPKLAWEDDDWRSKIPTTEQEIQDETVRLLEYARDKDVKTSAGINQVSWADEKLLRNYATTFHEAGADYVGFLDGSGGLGPEAHEHVASILDESAPDADIIAHPHNVFGMGTANALGAIRGGADVVEASVNHLCSASGQAALSSVVASCEVLYGIDTGIDMSRLTPLSRLVEDITGVDMPQNKPITGTKAWMYASKIALEFPVDTLIHCAAEPELFGNEKLTGIGKAASHWNVFEKLESMGLDVEKDQIPPITELLKEEISIRNRELTDPEIERIATRELGG